MQRKSPSSHPQDTLEQFQLDQADQAVVDLAFEEAVEAMIACACHQAVIAEPISGTQPSLLTSSESSTVLSATVAVSNCTALSLEQLLQLSPTEPQVSSATTVANTSSSTIMANSTVTTTSTTTARSTSGSHSSPTTVFATTTTSSPTHTPSVASYPHQPATSHLPQGMSAKGTTPRVTKTKQRAPLIGFLAEVFAPEVVAQVNQACQQSATSHATYKSTTDIRHHADNDAQQMPNAPYCNCEAQGKACTGNCTLCEEVTMDQLQFEQNSISGNQALYHTTAATSNITGDEDPVFSYHLYNRSYTHHPCDHDLQTYDPSNDKIEITICKDKHHGISIGNEASMSDPELECYELDFANEQELLEFIYQDSQDFFNELQLDQLLLETNTPACARTTTETTAIATTHPVAESVLEQTPRTTANSHKTN